MVSSRRPCPSSKARLSIQHEQATSEGQADVHSSSRAGRFEREARDNVRQRAVQAEGERHYRTRGAVMGVSSCCSAVMRLRTRAFVARSSISSSL